MSFYNMIFGNNPLYKVILATLDLTENDVGRFRDVFITEGKIAVYTRNGGNNRQHFEFSYPEEEEGEDCPCPGCFMTYRAHRHSNYLYDRDDEFDNTYATIYYSFPDEYAEDLKQLDTDETFDPSQRWLDFIEALKAK